MPKAMTASFDPRGKQVFEGACASCHGWSGFSLLVNEATLTGNRSANDSSATNVAQIVLSSERRQTSHGVVMMPAFGPTYSDAEIAAVANYVVARFGAQPNSKTRASQFRPRCVNESTTAPSRLSKPPCNKASLGRPAAWESARARPQRIHGRAS
jgi:cytochrome c553